MRRQSRRSRQFSTAIFCVATAIATAAPSPSGAQSLSDARRLIDQGRVAEARTILSRRVESNPSDADALALLARVTLDGAKSQESYRLSLAEAPSGPESAAARLGIASYYFANGFYSNAHRIARQVVDETPTNPLSEQAVLLIGRSQLASSTPNDAMATLEPLLSADDDDVRYAGTIVWAAAASAASRHDAVADVLGAPAWRGDAYAQSLLADAYRRLGRVRGRQNASWRATLARRAWRAENLGVARAPVPTSRPPVRPAPAEDESGAAAAPVQPAGEVADGAFALQVGVFGNVDNANRLANGLREHGFTVRIRKTGSLNRVWVGSYATREDARAATAQVREASGLDPVLVRAR